MNEYVTLSMCDLGRGIARGEIDPVALTAAYFEAIDSHPVASRIYARTMAQRAMAEAEAAASRAQSKTRRGLLDGVPMSWKDLFDTAGVATEAGSALLKGRVPTADAEVVSRGASAGFVALGKTHMSELAFSGLGLNPVTATPPCINDPDAVAGGSSSGAATSVAFGLAPGAVGSDTGGSVRIPAAWNDLVGLKTTAGRVSTKGVVPLVRSFDTVGPLTKTVEDAAEVFAVLDGTPAPDLRGATLEGARFLVLDTVAFDDIRDAPRDGFNSAVARLNAAGAEITHGHIPEVEAAMELSAILFTTEACAEWRTTIAANPTVVFDRIYDRFIAGEFFNGCDFVAAWRALEEHRDAYLKATASYDAVILPTAPILPPNAARLMDDDDYYVTENLLALRNTRIGNLMGLAALTLPTGLPSTGITLQIPPHQEARLLRLGAAAETALA